jgi:hypothetical protein
MLYSQYFNYMFYENFDDLFKFIKIRASYRNLILYLFSGTGPIGLDLSSFIFSCMVLIIIVVSFVFVIYTLCFWLTLYCTLRQCSHYKSCKSGFLRSVLLKIMLHVDHYNPPWLLIQYNFLWNEAFWSHRIYFAVTLFIVKNKGHTLKSEHDFKRFPTKKVWNKITNTFSASDNFCRWFLTSFR